MESGNNAKITLKIDYREQRSGIVSEIEKITKQFNCEIMQLPIGDYLIGDKIIIERKTIADFLASVKNGRIFQQAYRMANSPCSSILILEGEKPPPETTKMKRAAIQGVLLHLTVVLNIPVIRSRDIKETAWLINQIAEQYQNVQKPKNKFVIFRSTNFKVKKQQRLKLQLLQNISGIGTIKALALLRSFGSIEKISNADINSLSKVYGIGKKLANNIYTIIHEPYL